MKNKHFLLDTNMVSELFKPMPNPNVIAQLTKHEPSCCLASTAWNELLYGAYIMPEGKKKDFILSKLIDDVQYKYPIIEYDKNAAWIQADLRAKLKENGKTIDFQDTQIAAIAISNQLILLSRNVKHFDAISNVSSIFYYQNWFTEN